MNELVVLKKNDVFTNSLIIAEGTENEHESIIRTITNYQDKIKTMGKLEFTDLKSGKRGRPTRVYFLNEMQATFLITLLKNTDIVVDFKLELVKQFYQMRQILLEKQTTEYKQARTASKTVRKLETDVIKEFVEYARAQGSAHADKYYMLFTKLVNSAVGISNRDTADTSQLYYIQVIENIISGTITGGMNHGTYYKSIYTECKDNVSRFKNIPYLKGVTSVV